MNISPRFQSILSLPRIWLSFISLIWLILNLSFVQVYPAPNGDEVQVASISVEYLQTGRLGIPVWGDINGSSEHFSFWQIYNILLSLVFRLFGIGLLQARLFSLAGALMGGWLLYLFGSRIYNQHAGLVASTLYLFSLRVFWMGHVSRPETWVIVGGLVAIIFCWQTFQTRHLWQAFVSGLLVAVIVNLYITNIYNSLAIGLLTLLKFHRRQDWKFLFSFTAGGVLGLIYFLATHFVPDPYLMIQQWSSWITTMTPTGQLSNPFSYRIFLLPQIIREGFFESSRLGLLESTYIVIGLSGLLVRRKFSDIFLATITLILITGFLIISYSGTHHLIDLMPTLYLAIAATAVNIAEHLSPRLPLRILQAPLYFSLLLIAPLLIGYVGGSIYLGWQNRDINYNNYSSRLRQLIPNDSNTLGEGTWWWALRGGIYTADEYFVFKGVIPLNQPERLYSILRERQVEVILIDENLTYIYLEHNRPDIYDALVNYAQTQCNLAGTVEGYAYGVEQGGPAIKRTKVYLCPTPQ